MQTLLIARKPSTTGRFASLMELYESNYMLIRLLIPELRHIGGAEYPESTNQLHANQIQANQIQANQIHGNEPQENKNREGSLDFTAIPSGEGDVAPVYVSAVDGCLDLELSQIEHEKYTTTFNLTYRFVSDQRNPREPDLMIRIYHDARTCEVMSGLLQGLRHGPLRTRDLNEGLRLNRFLQKWVRYCLRQGHSFKSNHYDTYRSDRRSNLLSTPES